MKQLLFGGKLLTGILVFVAGINSASAATRIWDGGGANNNWNTAANWAGDIAPVANDDLIFPAAGLQQTTNNNFTIFTNFNSITVEGGTYTFGGNAFSLVNGINVTGGTTQSFNTLIRLSGNQSFTVAQGVTLTVVGLINSGFTPVLDGAGNIAVAGTVSGAGGLTKRGQGIGYLAGIGSYTGLTKVEGGILVVDTNQPNSSVEITQGGLGGTGRVGNVTASGLGSGIGAGSLTALTGVFNTGNLNLGDSVVCLIKLNGNAAGTEYDQINVNGTITLNNAVLVPTPLNNFDPPVGQTYTIITNDGTDPINGTFQGIPEGGIFSDPNTGNRFRLTYTGGTGNDVQITRLANGSKTSDYDGDGKADLAVFRPSDTVWYLNRSTAGVGGYQFGLAADKIVPADYDGDGKTDIAVFRNGTWYLLQSTAGFSATQWGTAGDSPQPFDYDGDGKADFGVYRNGIWYVLKSGGGVLTTQWGNAGDLPVVADYDGDAKADYGVYRNGIWYILQSTAGVKTVQWGIAGDKTVPADYDGDSKADFAVFRNGFWYLLTSQGTFQGAQWGTNGDIPAPADYDGDGKTDLSVFRNGTWFIQQTTAGVQVTNFGLTGDKPIPSAFVP